MFPTGVDRGNLRLSSCLPFGLRPRKAPETTASRTHGWGSDIAKRYSAIVVGAGHNGLVAANYLAKAGLQVLVLERREFVGGACITEELFPGFRVSSCSYLCHMLQSKVIDDLELRDHGLSIYAVDPHLFQPFPDGEYLLIWKDHERTADEIRRISRRDGDRFGDWTAFWERAAGIIYRYFLSEPPTLAELAAQVRGTPDEPVFERMLTGNVKDLVEEHFESELVRAAFIDAQDAGDPAATGSLMSVAYFECNLFTDRQNLGIPKGGMGGITQAMAGAAIANGVEIRTGVEVERIQIENGRASGVVLITGEEIEADAVVSNADPKRTFLTLVDADALEPGFLAGIRRLKTEVSYLKFHAALDELPDFTPYLRERYDPKYLTHTRICPSVQYFEQSWDDAKHGRPSSCPVMHVQIPSVYETDLTPPGQHVMSVWSLYAPVRLAEGTWDGEKQRVGEHLIDAIAQYAPNVRDAIIDWELFTPSDLEQRVYLTDGNIRHLDTVPQQLLGQRPSRQLSGYGTPIEGLYLCGAGTHPGGEVTGAPGHNAAQAILRGWEKASR